MPFQREHIFMNFNCPTRELAKGVSEPVNGVSKLSAVERVSGVSGASEQT